MSLCQAGPDQSVLPCGSTSNLSATNLSATNLLTVCCTIHHQGRLGCDASWTATYGLGLLCHLVVPQGDLHRQDVPSPFSGFRTIQRTMSSLPSSLRGRRRSWPRCKFRDEPEGQSGHTPEYLYNQRLSDFVFFFLILSIG